MINKDGYLELNDHNLQVLNNHKLKNVSISPTYGIDVDVEAKDGGGGFIVRGFHLSIYE